MPKLNQNDIHRSQADDEKEDFKLDRFEQEMSMYDLRTESAEDSTKYQALKSRGYSDDEIFAHMFSHKNPNHKDCRICAKDKNYHEALNRFHGPSVSVRSLKLGDDTHAEQDALRSKGFNSEQIESRYGDKKTPEISGGFLS